MSFHPNIIFFEAAKQAKHKRGLGSEVTTTPKPKRPRMLWQAAQYGQCGYRRQRDLQRLMGGAMEVPAPGQALGWLEAREAAVNEARRAGDADWNLHVHVMLMIALKAERRLYAEAARKVPCLSGP